MKKTYITPELEVVKIATQQMLATSSRRLFNDEAGTSGSGDDEEYNSL